jgi:hypothetical protein
MASRNRKDLCPELRPLADLVLERGKEMGLDVRLICTLRPDSEQAVEYAIGRESKLDDRLWAALATFAGKSVKDFKASIPKQDAIVTRSWPGRSNHRGFPPDGLSHAFDVGIFVDGVYQKGSALYKKLGAVCKDIEGIRWGGTFRSIEDDPHYELA